MKPMLIYGSLNGEPHMWFLVHRKLVKPEPGNVIKIRAFAIWMQPKNWVKVKVISKTIDGTLTRYELKAI